MVRTMSLGDRTTWAEPAGVERAAREVERYGERVDGPADADALVDRLADARVVLLGEATHGTSEFYRWRAHLTSRLVREHGFDFVAVEGDWTSCYEVNRLVKGMAGAGRSVRRVLESFERWPTWMWANWEVASFLEWLEGHNRKVATESAHAGTAGEPSGDSTADAGFYGLDVYSLFESMEAVVDYLEREDPDAAEHAREAYRCFEPYGEDAQEYARALRMVPESCEDEVVDVLLDLLESDPEFDGDHRDDRFAAEQNALVARNGEAYYRAMASGVEDSWNVRDEHMAETLDRLREHNGGDAKAVVWAHNTHVGDARATDMERRGRLNIGQLVREEYPAEDVELVGFSSNAGSVVAGAAWGAPMEEMRVPAAMEGSYESVFHRAGGADRVLFTDDVDEADELADPRGHRAIGVVYDPGREAGNYVPTDLRERYDVLIHLDETRALHPLEIHPDREAVPDLYPTGL
jgi:erythromycin esterase-like protein